MCLGPTQHACSRDIQGAQYCDISPFKKSMCTDDKSTTSSKESISMYLTYVPQVHIHENREPTYKLSFVGGLTVRPLLVLFLLVFVSSTISLSVLVCTSVPGGLEGVDSLGTGISSRDVCFAVCFSATGFRCIRLRRNSEPLVVLTTYDRGSSSLSLTEAVVQVFEDGLYTATACPDDKSSSSLLCHCPCC